MALFLFRDTSASHFRLGLNLAWIRPVVVVVVVIVLAATALGCGGEPETAENASSTPSSGVSSSAAETSRATPAPSPVSNPASVAARAPTETVNTDSSEPANNTPTQPAQPPPPTDTLRPPTSTPTPSPEPTPTATVAVHTQQGGAVMMQAPTSTPTPPPDPTPTATPVPGPYWEQFAKEEYDRFLPPRGAIQWPGQGRCQIVGQIISGKNTYSLNDSTPDGIKSSLQWDHEEYGTMLFTRMVGPRSAELMEQEQPNLFNPLHIEHFCGFAEALHPEIPVIRTTFEFNVRTGQGWKNNRGTTIYEWDAYRVEIRYIFVDNPEHRSRYLRYQMDQHGPILIEKLQSPCDRTSVRVNPDIYCQTAP